MKEQDIIFRILDEVEAVLPTEVTVRTSGGDASAGPPLCILSWDSTRLPYEGGHRPIGGKTVDETTGDQTGEELHRYHLMELDFTIRVREEGDRDRLLSRVIDAFLPFEAYSDLFHEDTTEWEVGGGSPRSNPVVEPDWYDGGLSIRFKYVSRVQRPGSPLLSVDEGENSAQTGGSEFTWDLDPSGE